MTEPNQPDNLELVRDVLDKQLVDHNHDPLGRADGIVLIIDDDHSPPRVATIESGGGVLARRLHPRLGEWVESLGARFGLRRGRPVRIRWSAVTKVGIELEVDVDAQASDALRWEQWLS